MNNVTRTLINIDRFKITGNDWFEIMWFEKLIIFIRKGDTGEHIL